MDEPCFGGSTGCMIFFFKTLDCLEHSSCNFSTGNLSFNGSLLDFSDNGYKWLQS